MDQTIQPTAVKQALPLSLLLGYGVGQVGGQIFRDTPAILLPIFLSTMLGVPAWIAGFTILIPKIWVIFCDPLVGSFSDRKKPVWGRRPFLLAGGLLSGISFFLLFVPPRLYATWQVACYATLIFTIASTGFSIFSVPYLTLASEMTDDTHLRTKILGYRLAFTALGLVIGAGAAQPMVGWFGGGRSGYAYMGAALGSICGLTMIASYFGTRGVKLSTVPPVSVPIFAQFRMAWQNRPFRIIAASYFIQMIGAGTGYTVLGLFFIYKVQNIPLILPFILVMSLTAGAVQPLWLAVSKSIGKKLTYQLCIVGWCAISSSWVFVAPGHDRLLLLPFIGPLSTQGALILARAVIIGLFNSGFILMGFSMMTDSVAWDRTAHAISREGIFSGTFSALEKLAFAIGPLLAGFVLSLSGFSESVDGAATQSASAIFGITMCLSLIPVALTAGSLLILRKAVG